MLLLLSADIFQNECFKKILSGTLMFWILVGTDLSKLFAKWPLVRKEFKKFDRTLGLYLYGRKVHITCRWHLVLFWCQNMFPKLGIFFIRAHFTVSVGLLIACCVIDIWFFFQEKKFNSGISSECQILLIKKSTRKWMNNLARAATTIDSWALSMAWTQLTWPRFRLLWDFRSFL